MFSDQFTNELRKSQPDPQETIENISMPSTFLEDSNFIGNSSALSEFNFSKTSEVNNTLDWSENLHDGFSFTDAVKTKTYDLGLNDEIHNFRRLCSEVNLSRMKYNRSKLITNTMDDLFNSSLVLPTDLKEKCSDKLRYIQFSNTLSNNLDVENIINIEELMEELQLNEKEINLIRPVVKNSISGKCLQLKAENEIIADVVSGQSNRVPLPGSILSEEEVVILDRVSELATIMNSCSENVETIVNFVDEIYDVRVSKFRELQKFELNGLDSKTKLINLHIKNLNYMIENALVQQYDRIAEAVNYLHNELQSALVEEEYSLHKTRALRESYDKVRGTRFDEILDEYKNLRENLKHKVWALRQLNQDAKKTEF